MTAMTVSYDWSFGDEVVVRGSPGRVSIVQSTNLGSLYCVRMSGGVGVGGDAWYSASDLSAPAPSTVISALNYLQLFTPNERTAIIGSDIAEVRVAVALTTAAGTIDLASETVIGGIDRLVTLGLITADRAARIKTGQAPA